MENEPGFIFEPYLEQQEVCQRINFLGNIRPDCEPYIAFFSLVRSDPSNILLNLYEVGNAIDNDPEVSFSRIFRENSLFIGSGYKTRPCNNSNDVFCDLVSIREEPPITKLLRVC